MRKPIDFIKNTKLYVGITLGVVIIGILCTVIFGVELDISFKGGTLLKYSYTGELNEEQVESFVQTVLPGADVQLSTNDVSGNNLINISLTEAINLEQQEKTFTAVSEKYADNQIESIGANSLDPSMGKWFFIKCIVAIALASLFLMIYVALRFRKIGGWTAGAMALFALLNDLLMAFFIFVIFRIPLNDNFVAVMLSILGYSLNATIVIYDRIRENRRIQAKSMSLDEIVNLSINQSFGRSMNTSLCTFAAVAVVAVTALVMGIDSIISFALPMMFGIISGFYTSTFLCTPLWAAWVKRRQAKKKKA